MKDEVKGAVYYDSPLDVTSIASDREKAIVGAIDLIAFIKQNRLDYPCLGDDLWDFVNEQTIILNS